MVQIQLKQKGKNRKLRIAKVRTKWESNILVADLFLTSGYAEFINQITALIKKWNVVDQGNEILKDFHGYR